MGKIVITGSTRGIGRALAERFLESGWSVVINGRSEESVSRAVAELTSGRPEASCLGIAGDASSREDMQHLWDAAAQEGIVDVWVNNAGIDQRRALAWELETEELAGLVNTNIIGSFNGSSAAVRGMTAQGLGITYLMAGFGSNGMVQPGLAAYGASKTAVSYLAKALAAELESVGSPVKSGIIIPGMVMTDLLKAGLPDDPDEKARLLGIYDILADTPETVSAFIARGIIRGRRKINWLTNIKAGWRFATAFKRKGRFSDNF